MSDKKQVITRFAPSPTGLLHIGGYRTALFNFIFAKKNAGKFIVRIEDTDRERSKTEYTENIIQGLDWLGFKYDEIYKQSSRTQRHTECLQQLIDSGHAYISKEESGERSEVIRFRNPNTDISWEDLIRGKVTFNTTDLGDFVIAKSIDEPLFHLAVVVDDMDSGITHIIRGEDHISNTPRQILIARALGARNWQYGHIPLILAPDKSKLSKRKGALPITDYKEQGFLPGALINYMALLGWNPGDDREIFSLDELIQEFDIKRVQKGGAMFNETKMRWINSEHLKKAFELNNALILEIVEERLKNALNKRKIGANEISPQIIKEIIERIEIISDIDREVEEGNFDYFFIQPELDIQKISWKNEEPENTKKYLNNIKEFLKNIPEDNFQTSTIKNALWDFAEEKGKGSVLWPMRYSLTGKDKSPDPFTVAQILGKTETISRIEQVLAML